MLRFVFAWFLSFLVFTPARVECAPQHDHASDQPTGWEQSTSTRHAALRYATNSIWRWRLYIPLATGVSAVIY
jgi:hypothetical protein